MDENKITELDEGVIEQVAGGSGSCDGHMITTALSKKCGKFEKGSNFYNKHLLVFSGTCGQCKHLSKHKGWHICDCRED